MNNTGNMQIEQRNLKTIEDQLNYECLMNKKFNQYAQYCTDPQLVSLCNESAAVHKRNFDDLKNYLQSHQ